jgi:hypothetical protein
MILSRGISLPLLKTKKSSFAQTNGSNIHYYQVCEKNQLMQSFALDQDELPPESSNFVRSLK